MKTHHIQKMHHKRHVPLCLSNEPSIARQKKRQNIIMTARNFASWLVEMLFFWCNSISAIGKQGIHEPPGTLDLIGVTPQCQLCHISMCTGPHNEHPRETNVQSRVVQTKLSVLKVQTTNWSRNCSRN